MPLAAQVKTASSLVPGTRVWHPVLQSGGTVDAAASTDSSDHPFRVRFDDGTVARPSECQWHPVEYTRYPVRPSIASGTSPSSSYHEYPSDC